jgi:hypothetical protein
MWETSPYYHLEILGHLGWKTINRGMVQVQGCEGLVKMLDGVENNRHCTACELTKSKLPPFPTGQTCHLKRVDPLDKCYIDLSGHISEESVFHKFHYYCNSVTRKGFRVMRERRYKNQTLMGVNKAGQHFRNGKIEVWHRIWKGMTRAMIDRAGMHVGW